MATLYATLEDVGFHTEAHSLHDHVRVHPRRLGSRKLRRMMNDTFADSVVDVDSVVDMDEPWGPAADREGGLRLLWRAENEPARLAFVSAPLEEAAFLGVVQREASEPPHAREPLEATMWRRVERRARPLLRARADAPAVGAAEQRARAFLRRRAALAAQDGGAPLLLQPASSAAEPGAAFERLLLHAVCAFYGLPSHSLELDGAPPGERAVVAYCRCSAAEAGAAAEVSLRALLRAPHGARQPPHPAGAAEGALQPLLEEYVEVRS